MERNKNWVWLLNSIDKCLDTAYNAKSDWAKEYWTKVADDLEEKYSHLLAGQPWLRLYDGKLN